MGISHKIYDNPFLASKSRVWSQSATNTTSFVWPAQSTIEEENWESHTRKKDACTHKCLFMQMNHFCCGCARNENENRSKTKHGACIDLFFDSVPS